MLQEAGKKVTPIRDALDLVHEAQCLIRWSPKQEASFLEKQLNAAMEGRYSDTASANPRIRPLCPTRWPVRTGAISAVLQNYEMLQETFEDTHKSTHDQNGITAGSMISLMDKFSNVFSLNLSRVTMCLVLLNRHPRHCKQWIKFNSQERRLALNTAKIFYQGRKDPAAFEDMYSETVAQAQGKTEEPKLPRQKKKPRRFLKDSDLPAA